MLKIKTDSRKVEQGDTFVAIRGYTLDGHQYIKEAIKNGATKIICEEGEYEVETQHVENTKKYLETYLKENYAKRINELNLVGVTGTNGKTTTCFLTYQILNKLKIKTAYIGTIGFYIENEKIELPNTTPDILTLYNLLLLAKDKDCKVVIMEVSSHSLEENRIEGLKFEVCAFTNLTQDHLDYHKTMDNYCKAKVKILNYLKEKGKIIVNADDSYYKSFLCDKALLLGINGKDYKIESYDLKNTSTDIKFKVNEKEYKVTTNLIGKFNVYNYLTSLAIIENLNVKIEDIIKVTNNIYAPEGRSQIIKVGKSIAVIDYAHTPDAVSKIIASFKEVTNGKIFIVIGCGGDRDPKKRPIMGNISTEDGDFVVFTNDNPRCENEEKIMNDILKGVKKDNYIVEYNRKNAIKQALDMLKEEDTLLILGKGHEDYQIIGREKKHLSDKEEVYKYKEENNI